MQLLKTISVVVLAAALSLAVTVSASASTFLASSVGASVTDKQISSQLFKIDAGNFECTKEASQGTTKALSSLTRVEKVKYSSCTLIGSALTISEAEYEFSADGSISVLNTIIIKSTTGNCTLKIPPTGNQDLKAVLFANSGNNLITKTEVKGLSYASSGGICGPTGTLTNGEFKGESEATLAGGKISWDK